jgi:hypothetical protein
MIYSKIHKYFAKQLNNTKQLKTPKALSNPEDFLGPNFQSILDLWMYIDTLSVEQREEHEKRYWALHDDVRDSSENIASYAAEEIVGKDVMRVIWVATYNLTKCFVFYWATLELIENKLAYNIIMNHKKH